MHLLRYLLKAGEARVCPFPPVAVVCLFRVWPAAQDNVARAVDGAVDHFLLGRGSVHHIAVPGIDCHMVDVQVAVVHPKGVEDQVPGGKASIGYGKVVLRDVPSL